MRVLLATIGSLGDLHPVMGLALELQGRGHTVVLATSPMHTDYVTAAIQKQQGAREAADALEKRFRARCKINPVSEGEKKWPGPRTHK